jgi:HAD superfamily hydrolase (TIGR01549 family)
MVKNIFFKKKLIIFDLDGVIINSLVNMRISWNYVSKKYKLNIKFSEYKKYIGLPFNEILINLNILKNQDILFNEYNKISKKNLNRIFFYKNIKSTFKILRSRHYLAVFTSKNKERTNIILSKLNVNFDAVVTPEDIEKAKPHPEGVKKIINIVNISSKQTYFVGDSVYDEICAKKAKVNFIFASWGYGNASGKIVKKINNIKEIFKYI